MSLSDHDMVFIFGLLGNIVSFMVFLAPLPTFCKIHKNKSSEGFQAVPYVVALLSALLLLYYGFLKTNAILIITINSIGCFIEVIYLVMYIVYAPRKQKISTLVLILIADIGGLAITMIINNYIVKGSNQVKAVGMLCAIFNIAVFAAPLSIMRRVIKTKSVEYMPFSLSLFLTLCAATWFFYGLFDKDYFIMLPNVLGFFLGISQMILYMVYKDGKKKRASNSIQQQWMATDAMETSADNANQHSSINDQSQAVKQHIQLPLGNSNEQESSVIFIGDNDGSKVPEHHY